MVLEISVMDVISILAVFLLLVFPIFLLWSLARLKHSATKINCSTPEEVNEMSKTGDLLALSTNNLHTHMITAFTQSIWSHIAIIFVDSDSQTKYVVEIGSDGFRQSFLHKWINHHRKNNRTIVWKRQIARVNRVSMEHFYKYLDRFIQRSTQLNTNYLLWTIHRYVPPIYQIEEEKCYCSEFVAKCLQTLHLLEDEKYSKICTPGELINYKIDESDVSLILYN